MIGSILSGTDFNKQYPNTNFYKVLNEKCNHRDFQYKHGLNKDTIEFNPTKECRPGGLYFTEACKLIKWTDYGIYICKVTIPDEARVYIEDNKFKADMIYVDLKNKTLIKDFKLESNDIIQAFKQCHYSLNEFPGEWRTEKLCHLAVQQDCWDIQYIQEKILTEEICHLAVQQDGNTLRFVPEQFQTEEICHLAVQQNGDALEYVPEQFQTEKICKIALCKVESQDRYFILENIKNAKMRCKIFWFMFFSCICCY
jgi:hypothetical protein